MASTQEAMTYYNIDIYNDNSTGGDISSKYSTAFNSPLLVNTSDYDVCVARARIPLDQIPLSQDNIPFEKWQIEIGVPTVGQPAHTYTYYNAFVPQFNALQSNPTNDFTIGINGQYLFTTSLPENEPPITTLALTLTPKVPALPYPVVLQLGGSEGVSNTVCGLTYTAVIHDNYNVSRYVTATNTFVDTQNLRDFFELPLANILGICMAPNSDTVYALIYDGTNQHYLCDVFNAAQVIKSIDETGSQLDLFSMSCSTNYISFGYLNPNHTNNYVQIWSLNQVNDPVNLFTYSQNGYTITYFDSNSAYFISQIGMGAFYMSNPMTQQLIQQYELPVNLQIDRFLGTDAYGNILVGVVDPTSGTYGILAYGKQTAILRYTIDMGQNRTLVTSNMIPEAGDNVNNPAPYAVQTINDYLRQINLAFVAIMAEIPIPLTSPQLTPYLEFNSSTSIISIVCDAGCWSGTNPAGINPPCVINFNQLLWSFFKFTSITAVYTALLPIGGQVRTLQINKALAPASSITPQPNSTVYRFSDLTRIVIGTSKMGVYGDVENNSKLLINLGDFTVDTEKGIPSLVIYNPTVLRFYKLFQTTPLTNIDIFISYANRAGEIFPVNISPYNSIGLKLLFKNRKLINQSGL